LTTGKLSSSVAIDTGTLAVKVRDAIRQSHRRLETNYPRLVEICNDVAKCISSTPDAHVPPAWRIVRTGVALLASHGKGLAIAHGDGADLQAEQARLTTLFAELKARLKAPDFRLPDSQAALCGRLCNATECDCTDVTQLLLALPLPTIYWEAEQERKWPSRSPRLDLELPPPIVRLIVKLDGTPVATPQLINPGRLYSVTFGIRGVGWPDQARSLHLLPVSTCPHEEYSVSEFELARPELNAGREYSGELTGQIRFNSAQSTILDDLVFQLRGAFKLQDGEFEDVPIIGYHVLRLRVVDRQRHPLMGASRRLDRHVEELLVKLSYTCPTAAGEIAELQPLLGALNRLITTYANEAIYKGVSTIPEKEFHKTVQRDLGLILGSDVQNHPQQAGGIGDLRYCGVIIELKVDKEIGGRLEIARKYTPQAAQYEGVEARQVSVVLVLDLTEKTSPPSDLRNDIILVDVPTHGGHDDTKAYPSKAFVVVINGNVKSPSDYSR
jgi:hypothetical protein